MNKTIVIIGAGPAGLSAAYQILKGGTGIPVIIEKDSQVGGISKTVNFDGNRIDCGGHRFFTKSQTVSNLWHEILTPQGAPSIDDKLLNKDKSFDKNGKDPEREDAVMLIRNRVSRIFAFNKFFKYPISIEVSTFINMGFVRTVKSSISYLLAIFKSNNCKTLEEFYIKRFGKTLYRIFFEKYTEKVWGKSPKEISASWGAQRVKKLSIINVVKEAIFKKFNKNYKTNMTSLIDSFEYPKFGPGQLYEEMANRIINMGGKIILNSSISEIIMNSKENKIESITFEDKDKNKNLIECDALFSSMPIDELINMLPASKEVKNIASNLPFRDFITIGVLLNKLKIKNKTNIPTLNEIIPDNWIYIQDDSVKLGRVQIFNNWSPYIVKDFQNKVWIGLEYFCNVGDRLWEKSDEEFITFAKDELCKIGFASKDDILDAKIVRVRKAYPAYFGSYENFDKVRKYLDTISNLYCIGRNGQHKYNNMDHSILTGIEATKLFTSQSAEKSSLWNINCDSDYHEQSKKE